MNRRRQRSGSVAGLLVASAIVVGTAGCADDGGTIAGERGTGGSASAPAHVQRAQAIEMAVARWGRATTLAGARAGAEEARNLITGPTVPGAGDADGNGRQRVLTLFNVDGCAQGTIVG